MQRWNKIVFNNQIMYFVLRVEWFAHGTFINYNKQRGFNSLIHNRELDLDTNSYKPNQYWYDFAYVIVILQTKMSFIYEGSHAQNLMSIQLLFIANKVELNQQHFACIKWFIRFWWHKSYDRGIERKKRRRENNVHQKWCTSINCTCGQVCTLPTTFNIKFQEYRFIIKIIWKS